MNAPVIFYMFLNVFAPVIINDSFLTTLVFKESITGAYMGSSKSEIYLEKSPNSKMLFLRSKGKEINTNLNVLVKSGKMYSFLILSGELPHSIVHIKDGKKDKKFKEIKKIDQISISEGLNVTRVKNISTKSIKVNSVFIKAKKSLDFPKGAPLFLDDRRVYK